ncbi:bacillithiol biosynthesis cysteine-adding enzyme BshC [Thermaerobacillus caldiproteolyticus]|uniref:Putative cysteine ligase BshC n=1 Tax=Thermaerobacillus caldiproteolyticus TaxID=247480 RepID=A0A7V9Z4U4_9BACL|nr:bacillithiol biosynthesis cysteine-adding enzyme BshC [Anoxybacillus caldiproteolyticus]MBA2874092.1 bacillithiol biosynthesis cysteine-adding enzyme BshC [Anoxybacillus caldiproteolyticus]QPA31953.1 bacillithiol biosynthesis cysteine-adding enzyme BshC [Anoxybacillus caldiproteolyticus]
MEMWEISLPATTPLATDYINGTFPLETGFVYSFQEEDVFRRRVRELKDKTYPRRELVNYLRSYHERFQASPQTLRNIEKLLDPSSVVIVGGQQAGLLTGPLYTIYKIISILKLAKEQEKALGVPVVPIFWIAGEDHDIAEVDHLYVVEEGKIKKRTYPHSVHEKRMVAEVPIDQQACLQWIQQIVETYGETNTTNEMLDFLARCLDEAKTFVDFFAFIVLRLFASEGLVVLNAADEALRKIESDFFVTLIERHNEITTAVLQQQHRLKQIGYEKTLEVSPQSANLFYYDGRERWLLECDGQEGMFRSKKGDIVVSKDELILLAKTNPYRLSNNVVTRPLMQEFLLPTLAFIAGPGEIAYWAELREAFALLGYTMPPVVPRLHITMVERSIHTDLYEVGLTVLDVLHGRTEQAKKEWLSRQVDYSLGDVFAKAKADIETIHRPLREIGMEIDRGLADLLTKNAALVQSQIDFLQQTLQRAIEKKYEIELRKFARIETSLLPNQAPQERIWNIFYYINKYGFDIIDQLMSLTYTWNGTHKIVYI